MFVVNKGPGRHVLMSGHINSRQTDWANLLPFLIAIVICSVTISISDVFYSNAADYLQMIIKFGDLYNTDVGSQHEQYM